MTVTLIPDGERIAGAHLRAHDAVIALVGDRVMGRTPKTTGTPWVKLTQLDARDESSGIEHLISYLLQLDCYGRDHSEVWLVARTVRAALKELQGVASDAVVTSVRFAGMARIPDQNYEPAKERIVLTAEVYAHP